MRISAAVPSEGQGSKQKEQMLHNAKALRSNQTEADQHLCYHLRAHRFMGLKFKRQKTIGDIADFVCVERRLIIELDGGQHAEQVTSDRQRDAWLRSQGYMVLRFWNNDVMQQLEGVLEQIRCVGVPFPTDAISPNPSPASGRRECPSPDGERRIPSSLLQGKGQGEGRKQR